MSEASDDASDNFKNSNKSLRRDMKDFLGMLRSLVLLLLILWAVFMFVIGIKMVPNDDMSPRLDAGDIMLYYKIVAKVNNNDIVVVKKNGTEYVGRLIARPGDTVEITKEDNLIINGNLVAEEKIFYKTPQYEGFVEYPLTLGSDEFFILCDHREGGEDSRYYGPVKYSEIKGILIGVYRRAGF
jgi:signal peptidase I